MSEANREEDAIEACLVSGGKDVHNRLAQVLSFLEDSTDKKHSKKNQQYRGICRAQVVDMDIVYGLPDEDSEQGDGGDRSWDSSKDEEADE